MTYSNIPHEYGILRMENIYIDSISDGKVTLSNTLMSRIYIDIHDFQSI